MVRFITVIASALSLLSFTHAATIDARGCGYACPATLRDGTGKLHESEFTPGHTIECLYDVGLADGALYSCSYSEDNGNPPGWNGPNCPEKAVEGC